MVDTPQERAAWVAAMQEMVALAMQSAGQASTDISKRNTIGALANLWGVNKQLELMQAMLEDLAKSEEKHDG